MYSITVIVPIYNTGRFLERCLDSIAKQTMQDIQVVLVDDGSTDESADIYQEYLNKYTNFELIKKENAGLGFARNSGLEVARGRYVAFLDSDDYVAPDFYEKMYRAIMLNKADTCVAGYTLLKNDGEKILKELQANVIAGVGVVQEVLPDILGAQPTERNDVVLGMSVWKNLFSVDVIKKYQIRFCSERQFISEDAIFAIDYYRFAKKVVILNECGYFYCENGVSLSRKFREDRFKQVVVLYQEEMQRISTIAGKNEKLSLSIKRSFIGNARYCMQQIYHNMPFLVACRMISEICQNEELQKVLVEYPWKKNPLKLRIFCAGMKYKMSVLLYVLLACRG